MSRAGPATTKHRTQNGFLIELGTVALNSPGAPGRGGSWTSRIGTPSDALMGITGPWRATITTRTPEQGCSAVNTTFFFRPPRGPIDGPMFDTAYRTGASAVLVISAVTGGEVNFWP